MTPPSSVLPKYVWMQGEFVPYADAKVHVLTHSLHYGSAVFEGIRVYETSDGQSAIFRAKEHFERFLMSLRGLDYLTDYRVEQLIEAARQCVKQNKFKSCYLRPIAYVGEQIRGLQMPPHTPVQITIAAWGWGKYMGDDGAKNGIRVGISGYRRPDVSSTLPQSKISGNYLNSLLARREAAKNGFDEALLLDMQGYAAEGPGENLFLIKDQKLFTPPPGNILPGITRDSVIQIAKALDLSVSEAFLTRNQLYLADELFYAGTAVEITAIREIDHHTIGNGKPGILTQKIADAFFKIVAGQDPKFRNWLTYV